MLESKNIKYFGKDLAVRRRKEKTPIHKHVGHNVKCDDTFLGWAVICDDCEQFISFDGEDGQ